MVKGLSSQLFQVRVNKFFWKEPIVKIFTLAGYTMPQVFNSSIFFIGSMIAAIDNMLMNGHGCVSVKVYLQK